MKLPVLLLLIFLSLFIFSKTTKAQEGPVISGVSVSASGSSATTTWTTDVPAWTSFDWGTNPVENDFTLDDMNYATSHSTTISSLVSCTVYYYVIFATNAAATTTTSSGSFTSDGCPTPTPTPTPSTSTSTSSSSSSSSSTPTPTPTPTPDTTPPSVTVNTNFNKAFNKTPQITGKATDDKGVEDVEFSIKGVNWLPVTFNPKSAKEVTFSFTPAIFEDGNYEIHIRAKDKAGNQGESQVYTLIIDRLPPQVGAALYSIGPQLVKLNERGALVTVAGIEQKVTVSAVGGPTTLEISAGDKTFSLTKNNDNGLWSGNIKFDSPGTYTLKTRGIDGAKNDVSQEVGTVNVLPGGKINNQATISVYYFEPILKQFVLWDGSAFSQENPQKTKEDGTYQLLLPPGKYFLEIVSNGFKRIKTNIFTISENTPITEDFELEKAKKFGPFDLPFINQINVDLNLKSPQSITDKVNDLIGHNFPQEVPDNTKLITFVASWHPQTAEQLKVLDKEPALAIFSQESTVSAQLFKKRGNYDIAVSADPDGKLVKDLNIYSLPINFFLDGKTIKQIKTGILNKEEIEKSL